MATLTIRDLDEDVVERLKRRAKTNNRSLEGEVRTILQQSVKTIDKTGLLERVKAISAMIPPENVQSDSTVLIREDRDSR
ncbi:MAG: DUF6364 family protein [Alphaproteobacteria bacterium]|nr:DUF6364 family protein [Alphaproteobacteria bacterium]